jgi:lipopolysaccharide transport system ATP-binding protein
MSPSPRTDVSIQVEGLSKRYRIGVREDLHDTFGEAALSWLKSPLSNFRRLRRLSRFDEASDADDILWALRDVSFEVRAGEVIGIIGRNGAGKSTLLKILSRITEPTSGRAIVNGRLSSLLEVGTGFHPELTGRENVYLNGTVLGMSKQEVDQKFDEIVDFSGVAKFIDTPVKRYSSGMRVRLGFAVAAHLQPEILLVDEVLAVGDAGFQRKCLGKMDDISRSGRTVVFVSHQMASISALCSKCILMDNGRIEEYGDTKPIVERYLQGFSDDAQRPLAERTDRRGNSAVRATDIRFLQADTRVPVEMIMSGQDIVIEVTYETTDPGTEQVEGLMVGLNFHTHLGQFVMCLNNEMSGTSFRGLPPYGKVYCHLPRFPLMTGAFHVTSVLKVGGHVSDIVRNAVTLQVENGDFFGTGRTRAFGRQGVYVPNEWSAGRQEKGIVRNGAAANR